MVPTSGLEQFFKSFICYEWRKSRLPWRGPCLPLLRGLTFNHPLHILGLPAGSVSKESACKVGDLGLIPGLGRSPGEGNSNPLQCSYLENPHGQRSLVGYSPRGHRVRQDSGTDFYFSLSLSSYFELSNYSFSRNCFTLAKKIKTISISVISEEVRHFSLPQLQH